jgi:hypothetical protein
MSHFNPKVTVKTQNLFARDKDLPRFLVGQLITAVQLEKIPQAIGALETFWGLPQTTFQAFQLGQAITAGDLNQFIKPLTRLGQRLGLTTNLRGFPVQTGDLITAETLNEIVDAINALRHRS